MIISDGQNDQTEHDTENRTGLVAALDGVTTTARVINREITASFFAVALFALAVAIGLTSGTGAVLWIGAVAALFWSTAVSRRAGRRRHRNAGVGARAEPARLRPGPGNLERPAHDRPATRLAAVHCVGSPRRHERLRSRRSMPW
ncbi:hypothetical protein [Nocardia sp. NRRL WC-3656]|uniref:hypothetical protein n=1 Tax=Nocardia sp. NRRL WC-3656 TaxID=1463824 RepID=UPI0012DC7AE2|nr:hypothetical protein [Nocardia sp. NRRL WC-3656]